MAVQEHRREAYVPGGLLRRLAQARPALLISAIIVAALVQFAGLPLTPALIGFAAIALAVLVREAALPGVDEAALYDKSVMPVVADRVVEAVVSGLPDPAIALTADSLVMTFNTSMQQVTPGILRGEPISFALRVPDVLDAVRAVAVSRQIRRIEFFQRVPTDRWWEATITPLVLPGETPAFDRSLVLLTL